MKLNSRARHRKSCFVVNRIQQIFELIAGKYVVLGMVIEQVNIDFREIFLICR